MTAPIYFSSSDTGAPTYNNVPGSRLSVLRAILVDGFNVKAVSQIEVVSGVATVTAASHGYSATFGKLVKISGCSVAALNGQKQPGDVLTNTFTYDATGVADGVYTGTIDARRVHGGYELEFNNVAYTKGVFKRTSVEATAQKLRVDDTATDFIRLLSVETATDVDTYTGPSPTEAMVSGGARWQCGTNNTTDKEWFAVVHDRGFWFCTGHPTSGYVIPYIWADGLPFYPGDEYFTVLSAQSTTTITSSVVHSLVYAYSYITAASSSQSIYVNRGTGPTAASSENMLVAGGSCAGYQGYTSLQPSSYTTIPIAPALHFVGISKEVRGDVPGMAVPLAAEPFTNQQIVTASGKTYVAVTSRYSSTATQFLISLDDWGF